MQVQLSSTRLITSSTNRPSQREDAQPNETSSLLPYRFRRPVEPPTIRPAAPHRPHPTPNPSAYRHPEIPAYDRPPPPPPPRNHHPQHCRSSSAYRANYPYHAHRESSSYRPYRPVEDYPRDPYRFRRHSAYENSHQDRHEPFSSSNSYSSYRSTRQVDRHYDSSSSIFPPLPDSTYKSNFDPRPMRYETCFTHPADCNTPSAVSERPTCDTQVDTFQPKHHSERPDTPHQSLDQPTLPEAESNEPNHPTPSANKRMRRTHSVEPSAPERTPTYYQIGQDSSHLRPPSPNYEENKQDGAPALKKRKTSQGQSCTSPRASPAQDFEPSVQRSSPQESQHASPQQSHRTSPQDSNPASPQESNPSSPQESNPTSPQETRAPAPQELKPFSPNPNDSESSTIVARSIVSVLSSREGVMKLMYDVLEPLGPISCVRIERFVESKRCIAIELSITFQHPTSAIRARWMRTFIVPPPFHHKKNPLIIHPKLSPDELSAAKDILPSRPRSLFRSEARCLAAFLPDVSISQVNQTSETPQEQDIVMRSISNDNNKTHRGRSVVLDKTPGDSCHNPHMLDWAKLEIPSVPPPPPNRSIIARAHFKKTMTRHRSVNLIRKSLESVGPIESVVIDEFEEKMKATDISCTVTYRTVVSAEKALLKARFLFPMSYDKGGSRLFVHPKPTPREQTKPVDPSLPASCSKTFAKHADQEDCSSDDIPLWNCKPIELPGPSDTAPGYPSCVVKSCEQVDPSNLDTSRSSATSHGELWVKGHFAKNTKHKKIQNFIVNLFGPFGNITAFKVHSYQQGIFDMTLNFQNPMDAKRALKSVYGTMVPDQLAFPKKRPHYLHVSFDYSPGIGYLRKLQQIFKTLPPPHVQTSGVESPRGRDASSKPLSPPPENSRAASNASNLVHSSRCLSPQFIEVKEDTNNSHDVTNAEEDNTRPDPPPPTSINMNDETDHDHDFRQPEPVPIELELPLRIVKYPIPPNCQQSHPSYISNRLHYKLEKIRLLGSDGETVLDSSWDDQHLILQVVSKFEGPFQIQPPTQPNPVEITPPSLHSPSPALNKVDELSESNQNSPFKSSPAVLDNPPAVVSGNPTLAKPSTSTIPTKKHRTWPFDPLPSHLDDSTISNCSKTVIDFLTTFLRLWEESRSDLRSLYDESAVFSNVLAKQGRKPLAITKSTGWPSIYKSISRLPALTNGPISDLIVDSCVFSLNPPRVVCSIHGSFSEFPKNIKRAYDRTLILRPVDTHLHPSEGCLGLLKWVALSDTLTIRKNSSRTEAIVEGFVEKRNALVYVASGFDEPLYQLSGPDTYLRAGTTSSRLLTRSPTRVSSPLLKGDVSAYSEVDHLNQSINSNGCDRRLARVSSENFGQSAGDLAEMQSQLRAMQAEIQHLKSLSQNPAQLTPTNQDEPCIISKQLTVKSPQKDNFKVISSTSCSHLGFGVSVKRLLLPTNLSHYLVVSMRGDILTWDPTRPDHSSQVQLLLSGASPTDIVDAACYSNLSQTLVVGSRISKTVRNTTNCSVRLVKSESLSAQRVEFENPYHESGVKALTLAPSSMNESTSITSFLTAGQEKFISLWKVTHNSNSFKKAKNFHKDVVKIHTDHTSVIQALAVDSQRPWVLSGGQDGKVYVTDFAQAHHQTLFSEEKNHIFDIQMNPVVPDTVMVTTGNKAPGSQFRYCDLRMSRPVISFGLAPNIYGNIESPIKYQRKGSLRDYLFSYPGGEKGGVLVWDLRYPTVPSSPLNTSNGSGIQVRSFFFPSKK